MGDDGYYVETWALREYRDQVDRAAAATVAIGDYTDSRIVGHDEVGGLISRFMGPHDQNAAERRSDYHSLNAALRETADALAQNADRYDREEADSRAAVDDLAADITGTGQDGVSAR